MFEETLEMERTCAPQAQQWLKKAPQTIFAQKGQRHNLISASSEDSPTMPEFHANLLFLLHRVFRAHFRHTRTRKPKVKNDAFLVPEPRPPTFDFFGEQQRSRGGYLRRRRKQIVQRDLLYRVDRPPGSARKKCAFCFRDIRFRDDFQELVHYGSLSFCGL